MDQKNYNHEDLQREYESLREEIRGNSADLLKRTSFALPFSITIIAYAWKFDQGFIAFTNIILIYAMLSNQMKSRHSTFRNAICCEVF